MHFYVKDHLGSNRLVVDGNGNIEEVTFIILSAH